jgi:MFS family permease
MLELTSSAHTSLASNAALVSFTIGELVVTLFAYLAQNWRLLKWANTLFISLVLPYLYFMPESPLFLYSKQQYDQLEKLLRRIARTNKRNEIDWYPSYQIFVRHQSLHSLQQKHRTACQRFRQIATHKPTLVKLAIIAMIGFVNLMLYIKISYGLAAMNVSPYIGICIGAIVEAAGYVTGSLLITTRLARKGSFIIMMIPTIISVTSIPIVSTYSSLAAVVIAQCGKYAISGAIAVSWIFVPELFPTSIRGSANGFFMAFSRAGAIVAPIITSSIHNEYKSYTFYGSSILAVVIVLLALLLPETKDKPMDDVQDYANNATDA